MQDWRGEPEPGLQGAHMHSKKPAHSGAQAPQLDNPCATTRVYALQGKIPYEAMRISCAT